MLLMNKTVKTCKVAVKKTQQGIALIESLIALLIFSMGILAIVGLQGYMVKATTEGRSRAEATFLAQNRIAMVWADPSNVVGYAEARTAIAGRPGWERETTINGTEVTVTIFWQQPGEPGHQYTAIATIVGG
jgi:type IV pilus assembly protein PilV